MISVLEPQRRDDFPWPSTVAALSTTRAGGVSAAPWDSLNLSDRVGDAPDAVARNCAKLMEDAELPSQPRWLWQVHGADLVRNPCGSADPPEADAAYSDQQGCVLAVQTADCLPVVIANRAGTEIAVAHAGWRGLAHGVLGTAVEAFATEPSELLAWLGPCIGHAAYEVDAVVREPMRAVLSAAAHERVFESSRPGHWYFDLAGAAAEHLRALGLTCVQLSGACTYSEAQRFFSFRRAEPTGRQATMAWIR